jgi:SAM-dependent methyltransferase
MTLFRTIKRSVMRRLKPATMVQARSTRPVSENWGFDRGRPIDRYYIDRFFASFAGDMKGDLLEIQEALYSGQHGRDLRSRQVLDIDPDNELATVIADLTQADSIASDQFDCFVLPQTLQFIFDLRAALFHAHRILKPGGVLLATVPAVSRIDPGLYSSDYWRFTPASCERLLQEQFGTSDVMVVSFGNALSCAAFIQGMSVEDFTSSELDPVDSQFPLILGIRARKVAPSPSVVP